MMYGELFPRASPEKPVSSRRNFRGCRTARTDGPDRLVCNQNTENRSGVNARGLP